jgi:Iron-sulfur cluster-binding domain
VRMLTEFAHDRRIATDYHINETPMLEQDGHFKHLYDNPTYIRPDDWPAIDSLVDWLIEKNKSGYQMVNSVQRLQEIKAFVRMSSGLDLREYGWNGDGSNENGHRAELLASMPGIVQEENGELHFAEWNCRAGQNNVIIRTDGTVAPCFPMYSSTFDWGNIDQPKFDQRQLAAMKSTCQRHCFSTLNHNLAYCYNDARVIKWLWSSVIKKGFRGGVRSFEN